MEQLLKISQQASHNQRVLAIIDYLRSTIERHEPQSEANTYRLFDRLADKLVAAHPQILITHNIVNKLKCLIHERLEDTEDEPAARKKNQPNLKELFADLSLTTQPSLTSEPQEEEEPRRVKIATIEELNNCREDLEHLYGEMGRYIVKHIHANSQIAIFQPNPEELGALAEIATKTPYNLTIITSDAARYRNYTQHKVIDLKNCSGVLKRTALLLVPCEAVLKNGAIIARSGALMLTITAKSLSIPVVALATCYTLTNRFCYEPNSFSCLQNPYSHFNKDSSTHYGQTLIVKVYDHVPPKHLDLVVTDIGETAPSYCYKLFERHYE